MALSSTFQRLINKVLAPAFLKPRCKPNTPSPAISPMPVWQAERTASSNPRKSQVEISWAVSIPSSTSFKFAPFLRAILAPDINNPLRFKEELSLDIPLFIEV